MGKKSVKSVNKKLLKAKGDVPGNDPNFETYVEAVIDKWNLSEPVDIMAANRMISAWLKLRYIEGCISKQGMFFEEYCDATGKVVSVKPNQMIMVAKQMEDLFQSYYRLFQNRKTDKQPEKVNNFLEWIEKK